MLKKKKRNKASVVAAVAVAVGSFAGFAPSFYSFRL